MEVKSINQKEVEKIKIENFDDFWNQNMLNQELKQKNMIGYQLQIKNEIVGFVVARVILDEIEIMNIATHKHYRRMGIAKKILQQMEKDAKQKQIKKILLEVNEKNIPAIQLYQKMGFVQVGKRPKYYNNIDTAILLEKRIVS